MMCECCTKDAPFFIETFSPKYNKKITLYFCREHLIMVNRAIHATITKETLEVKEWI